jgi:hypothetical protein
MAFARGQVFSVTHFYQIGISYTRLKSSFEDCSINGANAQGRKGYCQDLSCLFQILGLFSTDVEDIGGAGCCNEAFQLAAGNCIKKRRGILEKGFSLQEEVENDIGVQ